MKKTLTILAGVLLISACVQLPDILKTEPVRTASYTGSQAEVAKCIQQALPGGKVQRSANGAKTDVYDSKKSWQSIGVTHYAVTVYELGDVELRKLPEGKLSAEARRRLWDPVEKCIKQGSAA